MRVLLLCSSAVKAGKMFRELTGVQGIKCQAIVCHNDATSVLTFLAMQLARTLLAGPRGIWDAIRLLTTGRLHIRLRPFADETVLRWVRDGRFDVGLHAMGIIYRRPMIDAFRLGILNSHIGLLPKYRGRSVMEWSLLEGGPAGITTFFIDEGIDTGNPIVVQQKVNLDGSTKLTDAKGRLFSLDGAMYAKALKQLQSDDYQPREQAIEEGRRYYVMSSLLREVATAALPGQRES